MLVDAVINKPSRIATDMGRFMQVWNVLSPKSYAHSMNGSFRMFEDTAPAPARRARRYRASPPNPPASRSPSPRS